MSDKKPFDPVAELAKLSKLVPLKEFYSINIWNFGEIRLQGKFNTYTREAAKNLDILLEFDNGDGMIRGNNGFIYLVLTE